MGSVPSQGFSLSFCGPVFTGRYLKRGMRKIYLVELELLLKTLLEGKNISLDDFFFLESFFKIARKGIFFVLKRSGLVTELQIFEISSPHQNPNLYFQSPVFDTLAVLLP